MKYAIVYSSKTENTKYLAEGLKDHFKELDCDIYNLIDEKEISADFYFVGFWTYKGKCDIETEKFLSKLDNKPAFLFGTCGFGRSSTYFKSILKKTKNVMSSSVNLVGEFMCQGRIEDRYREKYEEKQHSFISKIYAKYMIENFDKALEHPNEKDLTNLLVEAKKALRTSEN